MLISCAHCGRIHDEEYICKERQAKIDKHNRDSWTYFRVKNEIRDFRSGSEWHRKRKEIRERDMHTCLCCMFGVEDLGKRKVYTKDIDVHHIVSLADDFDKRLDNDNLICLCKEHHKMATDGIISADTLKGLVERIKTIDSDELYEIYKTESEEEEEMPFDIEQENKAEDITNNV